MSEFTCDTCGSPELRLRRHFKESKLYTVEKDEDTHDVVFYSESSAKDELNYECYKEELFCLNCNTSFNNRNYTYIRGE